MIELYVCILDDVEAYLTQSSQSSQDGMSQTTHEEPTQNNEPFILSEEVDEDSEDDLEEVCFQDIFGTIDDDDVAPQKLRAQH